MSKLPQPGDAEKAAVLLNARMEAAVGVSEENPTVWAGTTDIGFDGTLAGDGADPMRQIYGDLMDVSEVVRCMVGPVGSFLSAVAEFGEVGEGTRADPMTLVLQGTAFGVLMERNRWERDR